jgi:hypothetical protein
MVIITSPRFASLSLTTPLGLDQGGTGSTSQLNEYQHPIQGQMFMVNYKASKLLISSVSGDELKQRIKKDLAISLAEKMLESGVIEFTQMTGDNFNFDGKIIKARCFLVPDDQVRILRTLYKDK